MQFTTRVLILLTGMLLTVAASAQSMEAPVHKKQFVELVASMNSVYVESLAQEPKTGSKLDLESRIFALIKTAHRLQEQAEQADLDSMKAGRSKDKTLMLVEQGCISVDGVLNALSSYMNTHDKDFLAVAANFNQTVTFIDKHL